MFWIRWAYKNLINNSKRTIGIVVFISMIIMIILVNLMFLGGTDYQMKAALRNNRGDLNIIFKNPEVNPADYFSLVPSATSLIEDNIGIFQTSAQLIGVSGYANGVVIGTESVFLKYLRRNVSWIMEPAQSLKRGSAIIEAVLARKLNVTRGDYITIQIRTVPGVINTLQVMVDGIFVGSNLIYGNRLLINIEDMNQLWLAEHYFNERRIYFKEEVPESTMQQLYLELSTRYYDRAYVFSPRLDPTKDLIFDTFKYYRYLLIFLFVLLNAVFMIILYFAVQNIYFMAFRARRQEISTLLTYGMKPIKIKLIVFWEALFVFLGAFLLGAILTTLVEAILRNYNITNPNLGELIAAIGGPKFYFLWSWPTLGSVIGFLFLLTIYSAYKGANTYLKMEVREIISHV